MSKTTTSTDYDPYLSADSGQASSPAKASSGPDLGLGQHAKAVELSLQAKALRQEAEQLYQASFYLELEALEECPPGAIHEYATRVLGAMYMGYRAKKFEAVVDLLDRARRNEPAFALVLREAESSFLALFLRAVDHPEARVDILQRLHRIASIPLDIPVATMETPRISFAT